MQPLVFTGLDVKYKWTTFDKFDSILTDVNYVVSESQLVVMSALNEISSYKNWYY